MSSGKDGTALTQAAFMKGFGSARHHLRRGVPVLLRIFHDLKLAFLRTCQREVPVR